ncbi:MAG: DUF1304 domain-containing protein [Micrococcus sp.]|nr:DUF1304 domain-containing protein [Micrococcus sp.]
MILAGLLLAGLTAAVHVLIFWLQSLAWGGPLARRTFGTHDDVAVESTREFALNQGFYNLFLAVMTVAGIVLTAAGHLAPGSALVFAGCGSMAAAGLLLFVTSPDKRQAALKQGVVPALAVVLLAVGLLVA